MIYFYSKKIIYCDIKLSNIFFCCNGEVKFCDFGVLGEFGIKGDVNIFIGMSYYMVLEWIMG